MPGNETTHFFSTEKFVPYGKGESLLIENEIEYFNPRGSSDRN